VTRRLFIFDEPDRFLAGAIGQPGSRAFYLQARQGKAVITVGLEKTQVGALAQRIAELLMAVGDRALLGVLAAPGCDLGQVGYETAMLVHRVADALEPAPRAGAPA